MLLQYETIHLGEPIVVKPCSTQTFHDGRWQGVETPVQLPERFGTSHVSNDIYGISWKLTISFELKRIFPCLRCSSARAICPENLQCPAIDYITKQLRNVYLSYLTSNAKPYILPYLFHTWFLACLYPKRSRTQGQLALHDLQLEVLTFDTRQHGRVVTWTPI